MKFAVFTASTPEWTPAEAVTELAAQGWDGVEWRVLNQEPADPPGFWAGNRATWPLSSWEEDVPAISSLVRDAGLEISGIGGYAFAAERDDVRRLIEGTATLGARQVRVRMPARDDRGYREVFRATRDNLEWAVGQASRAGVKVLVELHHGTISASASAAFRLIDGLDPAHIGVIHDLGNLIIEGREDALSAFELLGEYLAHVHVKNALWQRTGETGLAGDVRWENVWAPLRDGIGSVPDYFRALKTVGYDGWVTLEEFSTVLPLRERLTDGLAYLREVWESVSS